MFGRTKKLLPLIAATLLAAGILGGLALLGQLSRQPAALPVSSPSEIAYTDIECDPPPGLSRREFLDEIRYIGLPKSFASDAPDTISTIRETFQKHPRVDRVLSVEIVPGNNSRKSARIVVAMSYKTVASK